MRTLTLIFFLLVSSTSVFAQHSIGETVIVFNDPQRTGGVGNSGNPGRQIETAIFYPSDNGGADVDVSSGNFPLVILAHGFAMGYDAYENLWKHLVKDGYIVALPKTESSIFPAPSHQDFGLDISVIYDSFEDLNVDENSMFYEKFNYKTAFMGHSMGGGASVLAAANTEPDLYVGLSPAETNPSAEQAAESVNCPSIIFSSTGDEVTPPAEHQIPIFEALNSSCKYLFSIIGGAHCYYANTNTACDTGEALSGGDITIDREQQQNLVFSVLTEALKVFLKNKEDTQNFEDELTNSAFDVTTECETLKTITLNNLKAEVFPNPFQEELTIKFENQNNENLNLTVLDATGAVILKEAINSKSNAIKTHQWKNGAYFLLIKKENKVIYKQKVIKK